MPAGSESQKKKITAVEALETIQKAIEDGDLDEFAGTEEEADFLDDFYNNEAVGALLEMYDDLTLGDLADPEHENAKLVHREVLDAMRTHALTNTDAAKLRDILKLPHLKALLSAHDDVANENYQPEAPPITRPPSMHSVRPPAFSQATEEHRLVTITKKDKDVLGITVSLDDENNLIIARILAGSLADKQGLLHVKDKVREVNGTEVFTPEDMMLLLKEAGSTVTMKVVPANSNMTTCDHFFIRANFTYDPRTDRLIPCKKAGLPFNHGDVLQVVSTDDENWWQARAVNVVQGHGPVGLIPSRTLQEKRSAFVQPTVSEPKTNLFCGLKVKKTKKINYNANNNSEYDECDIKVYEEVVLTNYYTRVLALVGAQKVGKRALIQKLINENPTKFQAAIPYTSRSIAEKDVEGRGYFFTDRETMEREIRENKYLDYGEFDGDLYGIKFSTVRAIIKTGRVCVMAVSPKSLKMLKSPDFQPYIVFIAAPSIEALKVMYEQHKAELETEQMAREGTIRRRKANRPTQQDLFQEEINIHTVQESREIEKLYRGYFDDSIVNDDFENTYTHLKEKVSKLHKDAKWIPVDWRQI